ncbi:MAG: serpin family protein, partial [Tannerella sp.]|nr:serpin family protein [Tannerella sp.]
QTNDFKYASDESASYLELPYGNGAFSMVIALPHEGKAVGEVLENLDSENWNGIINNMYTVKVNVRLPRFKIECKYGMEKSILPDMGMKVPFLDGMADFGGISDISLFISQVIHRTFVEVDEVGTEAAAVTVVVMQLSASVPSNPVDFIVNKPFLFAIREKSTGVILFIGRVEAV